MANSHSPRASLLGIAPETRLQIYKYLFEGSEFQLHLPNEAVRGRLTSAQYYTRAARVMTKFPHAIIFVSRFLYAEAGDVLYSQTTLRICSMSATPVDLGALRLPTRLRTLCQTLAIDNDLLNHHPDNLGTLPGLKTIVIERCCVRFNDQWYGPQIEALSYMTSGEMLSKGLDGEFALGLKQVASGFQFLLRVIFHDKAAIETEKATIDVVNRTICREGVSDEYASILDDCSLCEQEGSAPRIIDPPAERLVGL